MENHHDKQKYNWETTDSLDSFAIAMETDGSGKCGYDAPYRGLKNLGFGIEDLSNYHQELIAYVRKCEQSEQYTFHWEWNAQCKIYNTFEKVKNVTFGNHMRLTKEGNSWFNVTDFMVVAGCFQIPVFVYVDPKGKTRSQSYVTASISTTVFIPDGNSVVSILRDSTITLPFAGKCLCILLKSNHFQWMKVKDNNSKWSTRVVEDKNVTDKDEDPLSLLANCCASLKEVPEEPLSPEQLYEQFATKCIEFKDDLTKNIVINWLKSKINQYSDDLVKLTNPNVRVCSWDPFCKCSAKDCGGWTPQGCKYFKNGELQLPKNYQEILYNRSKERTQEQYEKNKLKRKVLHMVNDDSSKIKKLEEKLTIMGDEMAVMQRNLKKTTDEYNLLKSQNARVAAIMTEVQKLVNFKI